jgi:hypothetical protein
MQASRLFVAIDPKSIIRAEEVRQILEVHRPPNNYAVLPLHETDFPIDRKVANRRSVIEAAHYQAERILSRYYLDTAWCIVVCRSSMPVARNNGVPGAVAVDLAYCLDRQGCVACITLNQVSIPGQNVRWYPSDQRYKSILLETLMTFALITIAQQYADEPA